MKIKFNQLFHESKSWTKLMVFHNIEITPELAKELLNLDMSLQRTYVPSTATFYAREMKEGRWLFNGDSIRVSKTGKALNGQHTLHAIIISGTTQFLNIQTGLEEEAFKTMDNGRKRTSADTLKIAGYDHSGSLSSTVKFIVQFNKGSFSSAGGRGRDAIISNAKLVEETEKLDIPFLEECCSAGRKMSYKGKFMRSPTYAGLLYILCKKTKVSKDEAYMFFELLATGENISSSNYSMIYLLRNRLINLSLSGMTLRTHERMALIIKAWNHYRNGKEISKLSWSEEKEDFPKPI